MKKILILLGIFFATAGIVTVVLFTTSGVNYKDAIAKSEEILASKELVSEILNTRINSIDNYDESKANNYVQKIQETKSVLDELLASKACEGKYKEKCDALGGSFDVINKSAESVSAISKFVAESKDLAGISNDTLSEMKKSSNEFIQQMASDVIDYRRLIDDFSAKYGANADATDYVSDYSKIADKTEELKEKYTKIDSEKLYGVSSEEILSFYDKVEELKNAFAEEK